MVKSLPVASNGEKEHLAETFATVNGFAVKDVHQIFHPSTQLRPAINLAKTHRHEDSNAAEEDKSNVDLEEKYAKCKPTPCETGVECVGLGCDVCIIAYDMMIRFCHHGDY